MFRPGDAVETAEAWDCALQAQANPSVLCLSRQALSTFRDVTGDANLVARGADVVVEPEEGRDVTLIATGSEVSIALKAAKLLAQRRCSRRRRFGSMFRLVSSAATGIPG